MRKRAVRNEYQLQGDDESIFTIARASVDLDPSQDVASRGGRFVHWMTRVGGFASDRRTSDAPRRHSTRID